MDDLGVPGATFDPHDPSDTDEKAVRDELTRVFDVCRGCRSCIDLCETFPTLFDLIERRDAGRGDGAGALAPAEQDLVVDTCHQCRRCATQCPYRPDLHELAIDVPRLMLRAVAMRRATGRSSVRSRRAAVVLGRLRGFRRLPGARRSFAAPTGSIRRRSLAALTGVTATRRLPQFARETFSSWFAARSSSARPSSAQSSSALSSSNGSVALVPTCVVDVHAPEIGRDLVAVYERRGIVCTQAPVGCCGAVALHAGDLDRFVELAEANVAVLADEVRRGREIVVAQPVCCSVIRCDYVDHVAPARRGEAELVAEHTVDAIDHLLRADPAIDLTGVVPTRVVYHVSPHLEALGSHEAAPELLRRAGIEVDLVHEPAGVAGPWGLRADHDASAVSAGTRLAGVIAAATTIAPGGSGGPIVVVGDDHLANIVIAERTGIEPEHPLRLIARSDDRSSDH